MIYINKGSEPSELTRYKKSTPSATYQSLPLDVKGALRASLWQEQGGLCAYCMCKIKEGESKIEHIACRARYPQRSLDYDNMLICCKGGEGDVHHHCDTSKGTQDLTCTPLSPVCINTLTYKSDGEIHSENPAYNHELNQVLKLNIPKLKECRKQALDGYLMVANQIIESPQKEEEKIKALDELLAKMQHCDAEGRLPSYCGIVIYFLKKKLDQAH